MTLHFIIKKAIISSQTRCHIIGHLKWRAYRVIRGCLRKPHESAFSGIARFSPTPSSLFLDVGANLGQSIDSIRLFAPESPIMSFEPNPYLVRILHRLFENDRNVSIRECALSSSSGTADAYIPTYNGYVFHELASLRKVEVTDWFFRRYIWNFQESKYSITRNTWTVQRIDDLDAAPFFIKTDVQGEEAELVKGGIATITKHRPVMLLRGVAFEGDIRRILEPLGYRMYEYRGGRFVPQREHTWNAFLIPEEKLPKDG